MTSVTLEHGGDRSHLGGMTGTSPHASLPQAHYRDYGKMTYARSIFVIHNIAHQGRGPFAELSGLEVSQH